MRVNVKPQLRNNVDDVSRQTSTSTKKETTAAALALLAPAAMVLGVPTDANAVEISAVSSAFAAYGHYLGLVLVAMSLATERVLIKAGMSEEDEQVMTYADIVYGLAGTLVLATGYFRVVQFGKGWEFYSHEPIFWVKMLLFSIMGSSSLFPTIKIVQRAIQKKNAEDGKGEKPAPITAKLAARITKVVNGELLALCSIPLAAALMTRGVGYMEGLPWQAGAAPVALATIGLGVKYTKEALSWTEDE